MTDWIEVNLPLGASWWEEFDEGKCWINSGLHKVGVEIRLSNGKEYLIGDINVELGMCDCCRVYDNTKEQNHTVVEAYRVVFEREVSND